MKRKIIGLLLIVVILMTFLCGCKIETSKNHNEIKGKSAQSLKKSEKNTVDSKSLNKDGDTSKKTTDLEAAKNSNEIKSKEKSKEKSKAKSKAKSKSQANKTSKQVSSNAVEKPDKKSGKQASSNAVEKPDKKSGKQISSNAVANPGKSAENQSAPTVVKKQKAKHIKVSKKKYVTITIRCDTILKNWENLNDSLKSEKFVPKNGVILKEIKYEINGNETVFNILVKAIRENRIHMEYQGANLNKYGSVYVQGINNLYEFSCGQLSGWMYCVNGTYPMYGCSKYNLKDGDIIQWNYTCDLGRDLGVTWLEK